MTALNKQALREAAEKALPAMKRLLMMPNDELFDEALLNVDGDVDAANAFNLIAGPETMLALLDENLQLQRNKDSLEAAALAMRDDMREAREKLEAAEKRIAELRDWSAGLAQESFTYQQRVAELEAREIKPAKGEVLVVVSGFTGCGKSAIAGEIEIAMKAIGVPVAWSNGDAEKRMTGADWLTAIDMYKPSVRIIEVNVPRAAGIGVKGE